MQILSNHKLHAMICAVALAVSAVAALCWRTMRYKLTDFSGDGRIYDFGLRTFPRYRVTMHPIKAVRSQKRIFHLNNLPRITADVLLQVSMPLGEQRATSFAQQQQDIQNLPVSISCELLNEQGQRVCFADGPLNAWEVAVSERGVTLWQKGCRAVRIEKNKSYVLSVSISVAEQFPQEFSMTPVLQGGGNEGL